MLIEKYIGNKKTVSCQENGFWRQIAIPEFCLNHTLNYEIGKRERIKCMSSVLAKKIGDRLALTKVKHFNYLLWYQQS